MVMALNFPGLDMDEALRTLDLVGGGSSALDMVMQVKGRRTGDVTGESNRTFADNKPRMDILGYYLAAASPTDQSSGMSSGRRQYSAMRVVRYSDSATASFLSMFSTNEDGMVVDIAVFKAGGDAQSKDKKPILRIVLKSTRIRTFTLLGGCVAGGGATEIIEFAFREIQLDSAPQESSGSRGGVRSFMDSLGENT
jgi:type VI protein secretion system component Hcp